MDVEHEDYETLAARRDDLVEQVQQLNRRIDNLLKQGDGDAVEAHVSAVWGQQHLLRHLVVDHDVIGVVYSDDLRAVHRRAHHLDDRPN